MPYVTARDGQRLHVRVLGRGRPVLLLHGLGSSSLQWLPFVLPLLGRAQFFIPDLRGAGGSAAAKLNQDDMFQNHVEDVEDIVRHFGLRDVLLAGHSMGATTALHWLQAGGFDQVRAYLHIDQAPSVSNREDWPHGLFGARQEEYFDVMRRLTDVLRPHREHPRLDALPVPDRHQVLELMAISQERQGMALPALVLRAAKRLPRIIRLLPLNRPGELYRILATYLDTPDYREALRHCPVPVTVMVGMNSLLYAPEGQMAMAEYAPQCRIVRFERSGHMLPFNEPLKFARELGRFIDAHAAPAAPPAREVLR
jgi:pimeloyl-ACP methyl ester carboxylesterase